MPEPSATAGEASQQRQADHAAGAGPDAQVPPQRLDALRRLWRGAAAQPDEGHLSFGQDLATDVLWRLGIQGAVVCTLGRTGLVLGDEETRSTWWVGLADKAVWQQIQHRLRNHPEVRNGMGDGLLGCWVGEHRGNGVSAGQWSAPVAVAVRATRDVLQMRGLLPEIFKDADGSTALEMTTRARSVRMLRGLRSGSTTL